MHYRMQGCVPYMTPQLLGGARRPTFRQHLDHEGYEDYMPDRLTTYNRFGPFNFTAGNNYQHRSEFVLHDQFISDFAQQQRQYLIEDNDSLKYAPQGPAQQRSVTFQPYRVQQPRTMPVTQSPIVVPQQRRRLSLTPPVVYKQVVTPQEVENVNLPYRKPPGVIVKKCQHHYVPVEEAWKSASYHRPQQNLRYNVPFEEQSSVHYVQHEAAQQQQSVSYIPHQEQVQSEQSSVHYVQREAAQQ